MTSERIASSLARPPALRMTCASPSLSPAYLAGSSRASMHVRIAKRRAGGRPSSLLAPKSAAYAALARTTSSFTLIPVPPPKDDYPTRGLHPCVYHTGQALCFILYSEPRAGAGRGSAP